MSGEPRPLLALDAPEVGVRLAQSRRIMSRLVKPSAGRQGARLSPQFRELAEAFNNGRAQISEGAVVEIDPELVVVFDLAGSVSHFKNAVDKVEGLEFLSEYLGDDVDPDEDFFMEKSGSRTDAAVRQSLCLVMTNARALTQLINLFNQWQSNPDMKFDRGLTRFKYVFEQLRAIRRWGPEDRIRETGLIEEWQEKLLMVGQSQSPTLVEIELWYRRDGNMRASAEELLRGEIRNAGGQIRHSSHIPEISYHSLLVELPIQQIAVVLERGAGAIRLLDANEIMFVSPFAPMTVDGLASEDFESSNLPPTSLVSGLPRVALLDGLPFTNHDLLKGRLIVDDPDDLEADYPVASRRHGTAMSSLITHGDLSKLESPMKRPLYVRPVMQPHEFLEGVERVVGNRLLTDLLHSAVRRIVVGEDGREPVAPSVRIINLSIGAESRAFVRRVSPLGRLIDWLSIEYNLLFIISAGNHRTPLVVPAIAATDQDVAKSEALKAARRTSRLRGILPPGDALNALTVGAAHTDELGDIELPDTVWDITGEGMPSLYGAVGPGVGRSIKPELFHSGGRSVYVRPVAQPGVQELSLEHSRVTVQGPGTQVATPGRHGSTNSVAFTHGTSNAAAQVTREADQLFDLLEAGQDDERDLPFPDPLFHPVLAKALLVHASSWGQRGRILERALDLDSNTARRELTALLGYGFLDKGRLGSGTTNRAVLVGAGLIGREQRHAYHVPLPVSLRAKSEWHRYTVTLAYLAPTVGHLTRYRGAKVFFEKLDDVVTGGKRVEAEHAAVRRGSCQQEIIEGNFAMVFGDNASLPIHVVCMDDAQRLTAGKKLRYAIVVSVETAVETSATIHDEIRMRLQAQARDRAGTRVRP